MQTTGATRNGLTRHRGRPPTRSIQGVPRRPYPGGNGVRPEIKGVSASKENQEEVRN